MKRQNSEAGFRDLDPWAAYSLSEHLQSDALYIEGPQRRGTRTRALVDGHRITRRALVGLAKECIASRRAARGDDTAELKKDDAD
jgi:hypothetical protein